MAELSAARRAHFARLGQGPELYVELMVASGRGYRLSWNAETIGYCLVAEGGCLLELALAMTAWAQGPQLLRQLAAKLRLSSALGFTFDPFLLGVCLESGWSPTVEGICFRDLADDRDASLPEGLTWRRGSSTDIEAIAPHRHGVFGSDDELALWIERGFVHVLEGAQGWIALGLDTPVWEHGPERDLGVLVHPDHRRQGHATFVLRTLKRSCLDRSQPPIAGCGADNIAARRALVRAGWASRHHLLRFAAPNRG